METKFFLLTEQDNTAIAVVGAKSDSELSKKVEQAISEHFCYDIVVELELHLTDCENGMTTVIPALLDDESEDGDYTTYWVDMNEITVY
jgi:hypothetical protein